MLKSLKYSGLDFTFELEKISNFNNNLRMFLKGKRKIEKYFKF